MNITSDWSSSPKTEQFLPPGAPGRQVPALTSQRSRAPIWQRRRSRLNCLAWLPMQTLAALRALRILSLRLAMSSWTSEGLDRLTGEVGIVESKIRCHVAPAGLSLQVRHQRLITPSGTIWPGRLAYLNRNLSTVCTTSAAKEADGVIYISIGTKQMAWLHITPIHTLESRALSAKIRTTDIKLWKSRLNCNSRLLQLSKLQMQWNMAQLFLK